MLHAGDFISAQVLQDLEKLGPPVVAVSGNMDEQALKQVLPKQRVIEVDAVRIGMVHDPGPRERREARLAARFEDCGAVVYGHTHKQQEERFQHLWVESGLADRAEERAAHSMIAPERQGDPDHASWSLFDWCVGDRDREVEGGVENPPFRQRRGSGELPRERGLRLPLNPPKSLL